MNLLIWRMLLAGMFEMGDVNMLFAHVHTYERRSHLQLHTIVFFCAKARYPNVACNVTLYVCTRGRIARALGRSARGRRKNKLNMFGVGCPWTRAQTGGGPLE